jgi:sec-independent protein translocase protein TatB
MFNIGMMELLVILIIAFLIVGPKDLPKVARWIARCIKKAKGYVEQFKEDMGLDEIEEGVKKVKAEADEVLKEADVTEDVRAAQEEMRAIAEGLDYDLRRTEKEVQQAIEKE